MFVYIGVFGGKPNQAQEMNKRKAPGVGCHRRPFRKEATAKHWKRHAFASDTLIWAKMSTQKRKKPISIFLPSEAVHCGADETATSTAATAAITAIATGNARPTLSRAYSFRR